MQNSPKPLNRLLALLPEQDYQNICPYLEPVSLELGTVLYQAHTLEEWCYFPTTCIVSLLYVMENGSSAEMAIAGNEGMVGIALFLGGDTMPSRWVVQSAGDALRIRAKLLRQEFRLGSGMQEVLLRYTHALITQMSQTAVCNRLHSVDKQLCRWLLLSHDRLTSNTLTMTQELMSHMLGVRRAGITQAAGRLQAAKLITYSRGRVTILDRAGLEARVCECYHVVKKEFDRLLGPSSLEQAGLV